MYGNIHVIIAMLYVWEHNYCQVICTGTYCHIAMLCVREHIAMLCVGEHNMPPPAIEELSFSAFAALYTCLGYKSCLASQVHVL